MNLNFLVPKSNIANSLFFIIILILTIVLGSSIFFISINNDVTILLPHNKETIYEKETNKILYKEFSSSQELFVGISGEPFIEKNIKTLWNLCNEINNLEVVKSTLNPFNGTYFKKVGNTFTIVKMKMNNYPKSKEGIDDFIKNISSNRYLVGSVISYDKKSAGIVIRMNPDLLIGKEVKPNFFTKTIKFLFNVDSGKKPIDRSYFCNQIENVIKKYNNIFKIYYAGVPVYEAKTKAYMFRDLFTLMIPAMILMLIILFLNFRTIRGTFLPVLCMMMSLLWTFGIIGWFRYKLNIIGIMIPPLILTLGSSYTLYYLSAYYEECHKHKYKDKKTLVINATKNIGLTIILASLTTIVGFASFLTASIDAIREFAVIIIISDVFTLFFTFFFISKILIFIPIPHKIRIEAVKNDIFSKVLDKLNSILFHFRYLFISTLIISIILYIILIPKLKVETNAANFFKASDHAKISLIYFQKEFGGTTSFNITLRSSINKRNFFKTKEGILIAKKIQDYLDKNVYYNGYSMIGWTISPVTLVEDLNQVLNGSYDIPQNEKDMVKFFTFLKVSNDPGIKTIINSDFSAITFVVRCLTNNEEENEIMTDHELLGLLNILNKEIPDIIKADNVKAEIWGEPVLLSKISKYLIGDQLSNIISTLGLIFIIILIQFRSPYYALASTVALSFSLFMNFSVMSILKIPLDSGTVMISAIAIGVGVDSSVHFLVEFRKKLMKGLDTKQAIGETFNETSRTILFTMLALIAGFSVFLISSFNPIIYFGGLISLAMITCSFGNLFILPSFLFITEKLRLIIHKDKRNLKK